MARAGRVRCETDLYHVTIRGCGRQIIFEDAVGRNFFLDRLELLSAQERVDVIAYCLMDNHVHIVLFDPEGDLGVFMQRLCCVYARYFNERHDRSGHLFQEDSRVLQLKTCATYLRSYGMFTIIPSRRGSQGVSVINGAVIAGMSRTGALFHAVWCTS